MILCEVDAPGLVEILILMTGMLMVKVNAAFADSDVEADSLSALTLLTDRLVKAIACIKGNSDTITILPNLIWETVRVDVDKVVFLLAL